MLSLIILLSACSPIFSKRKIKAIPARVSFCEAAEIISWSKKDTPATVALIKEHNAVGVALKCPKWTTIINGEKQ